MPAPRPPPAEARQLLPFDLIVDLVAAPPSPPPLPALPPPPTPPAVLRLRATSAALVALVGLVPCVFVTGSIVTDAWGDPSIGWALWVLLAAFLGALAAVAAFAVVTVGSSAAALGGAAWSVAAAAVAVRRPPRAAAPPPAIAAPPAPSVIELIVGFALLYVAAVLSLDVSGAAWMVELAATSGAGWRWYVPAIAMKASFVVLLVVAAAMGASNILYFAWAAAGAASLWWRATAARGVWPPAAAAFAVGAAWRRECLVPAESAGEAPVWALFGSLLAVFGVFMEAHLLHIIASEAADRWMLLVLFFPFCSVSCYSSVWAWRWSAARGCGGGAATVGGERGYH
eukprot:TRINITY_DN6312_c0_g1_i1.p1 TRINITY_DN6312_c0_g1~~TRINITY_DN6312_c0_g1_i1.p1  ORF type:complete len:380 (-),score=81.41 TRINITY_DN6312_c0_g1_i1:270-1295(-)